jgi:hypothetical protein
LLLGVSTVNGYIRNPSSNSELTSYWKADSFENGNIIENKLCTVTGKIPGILK